MNKVIVIMVMGLFGLLCAEAGAGTKDKGKSDDIQTQYIERLSKTHHDLLELADDKITNAFKKNTQRKLETLELQYKNRVPLDLQLKRKKIDDEDIRIQAKTSDLEKSIEDLRLDALKYYKGKMPVWLKKEWEKETLKFAREQLKKSEEGLKQAEELAAESKK